MNSIISEFNCLTLPDARFENNFSEILLALNDGLGLSFSRALGDRLRKSAWRLFSREELDLQVGHRECSLKRCSEEKIILAIEDTTDLNYSHHKSKDWAGRLGGPNDNKVFGANVHTNMLLTTDGVPLGIAYQRIWLPSEGHQGVRIEKIPIENKESFKWILALRRLNALWKDKKQSTIIKISDRESDFYELYEHSREPGVELLQRVHFKNRKVIFEGKEQYLIEVLKQLPILGSRRIKIPRKAKVEERIAEVNYYATSVKIPPSGNVGKGRILEMQVIWVKEQSDSKDAIEWIFLTTLSGQTLEDVLKCVKFYTYRWIIERFHYILKQTLFIEAIQIDDFTRLNNVLQIYSVIAWHLLWLYRLGHLELTNLATDYFDEQSIEVLEVVTKKKIRTVDQFIKAIAQLAGFEQSRQQRNPGEKTLYLGMIRFFALYKGYIAAKTFYATG